MIDYAFHDVKFSSVKRSMLHKAKKISLSDSYGAPDRATQSQPTLLPPPQQETLAL